MRKQSLLLRIPWLAILLFGSATIAILFGWQIHNERYIVAESGIGYWLGIIGGSMMLLLLLYPLRKHLRFMRNWGKVSWWFKMHMMFGVYGPVLILYHSNFNLGSLNSAVALISMLIVASSGLFGRFFYSKIHFGLYGRKASLKELKQNAQNDLDKIAEVFSLQPEIKNSLEQFEETALKANFSIFSQFFKVLKLTLLTRMVYWRNKRRFNQLCKNKPEACPERKEFLLFLKRYLFTIQKTAEYAFYDRMFSWWHILHLPLFFMAMITGVIHVISVHMY